MPSTSDNHAAYDYAERIRERLPRRLHELREASRLSMYALWCRCGMSRDTISRIEAGDTIPGVPVLARLAWGVGRTITDDSEWIEATALADCAACRCSNRLMIATPTQWPRSHPAKDGGAKIPVNLSPF